MYAGKGAVAFSVLFTTYRRHQLLSPAQLRPIQLLMLLLLSVERERALMGGKEEEEAE